MTHPDLIERQFERLRKVENALANGAHYADDPECHPLYPCAVAARQILEKRISTLTAALFKTRNALAIVGKSSPCRTEAMGEADKLLAGYAPFEAMKAERDNLRATLTKGSGS